MMAPPIPAGRRFAYGISGERDLALRGKVSGESGQAFGEVLDLSLTGCVVWFAIEQSPRFFIGEKVALSVDGDRAGAVRVLATVRARTELDGFRRFEFAFEISSALRARLSVGLLRSFNERKAVRVEPGVTVLVTLQIPSRGFQTTGRMRDVSVDGVGVVIDFESERTLSRVLQVGVEFTLPDGGRPMRLEASIRNRSRLDDGHGVYIGLCFDPQTSSADFVCQRKLTEFVMARQRELLQVLVQDERTA